MANKAQPDKSLLRALDSLGKFKMKCRQSVGLDMGTDKPAQWKNGRPADWIGNPDYCGTCEGSKSHKCSYCVDGFEAGASAMLAALIKWLDGKCDDPDHREYIYAEEGENYKHRKDCPQCWKELKEMK